MSQKKKYVSVRSEKICVHGEKILELLRIFASFNYVSIDESINVINIKKAHADSPPNGTQIGGYIVRRLRNLEIYIYHFIIANLVFLLPYKRTASRISFTRLW